MSQSSQSDPISGARALVVEDEFLIAIEVQQILEAAGAREVVLAARTAEALAALEGPEPFDLAVLDVKLGRESSERIALVLIERGIPFVYGTGLGISAAPSEQLRRVPIVNKPYTSQTLLEALVKAIRDIRGPGER